MILKLIGTINEAKENKIEWQQGDWALGCNFSTTEFISLSAINRAECAEKCQHLHDCSHYTYEVSSNKCSLRFGTVIQPKVVFPTRNHACGYIHPNNASIHNKYLGCFLDDLDQYLDISVRYLNESYAVAKCLSICFIQNFKYAVVKNGNECRCGLSYGSPSEKCDMQCLSNAREICDKKNSNEIYQIFSESCEKNHCQNEAVCIPQSSDYECKCLNKGYSGKFCENYDACWNDPCEGCVPLYENSLDFKCTCKLKSKDSACESNLFGKILLFTQNDKYLAGVDNKNRIKIWNKSSFVTNKSITFRNASIKSVTLLENELLAVGSSKNSKIEIWNITSESRILILNEHEDCVNALLSISLLNRTHLISGSADTTLRLYDNMFKHMQSLKEQTGPILELDYNPYLQLVASSSSATINIWSLSNKLLLENKTAHEDYILKICVLENGLMATGSSDKTIRIWQKTNNSGNYSLELLATLTGHTSDVYALIQVYNNSLISGCRDGFIKAWNQLNKTTFECVTTINDNSGIRSLAISGRDFLIVGHLDGSIHIRNQTSFVLLQTLKEHTDYVRSIILLNNQDIATASDDSKILIWQQINETSFQLKNTLTGHNSSVTYLAVLPNNLFASGSTDTLIKIWNQTNFECVAVLSGHTDYVQSFVVYQNEILISNSYDKKIIVWNISSFTKISVTQTSEMLYSIASFSDGCYITGDIVGSLKLWDLNSLGISFVYKLTLSEMTTFIFFQKNYLVSGHSDGFIKIWKVDSAFYSNKEHESSVTCLANINDRNLFASGSTDQLIKIWDSNFKVIQTLAYHAGTIVSLIYLDGFKSLMSSSSDMKTNFYKSRDIKLAETINSRNKSVHDIVILNEETNLIATCSGEKTIEIWNNSFLIKRLSGHVDYVYALKYSPNDNILISGSRDSLIKLWNCSTFNQIATLSNHDESVISLALIFIEKKTILISGSCDYTITIWSLRSFQATKKLKKHTDCVNALNVFDRNKFLLSGSSDKRIFIWDIQNDFVFLNELTGHDAAITSIESFSNSLATASEDKTIIIWSYAYKLLTEKIKAHNQWIQTVCVLKNGLIATGSSDKAIKIWQTKNKNSKFSLQLLTTLTEHTNWVNTLIELNNNSLISGCRDGSIKVWNQLNETSFECVATFLQKKVTSCLAILGSNLLIMGYRDGSIQIRNQTTFLVLQTLIEHTEQVRSIVFLSNQSMATASQDKKIMIWQKINETSFQLKNTLNGHNNHVTSLAVLANNLFASASGDTSIRIWNQTSFECIHVLNGHSDGINGLLVDQNTNLISISGDGAIVVWSTVTFLKITTTHRLKNLYALALLPNELFAIVDEDGAIQIWLTNFTFQNEKTLNHDDCVSDLAFMKNGFLTSTSLDKSIKIWDNSFEIWSSVNLSEAVLAIKVKTNGDLISSSQDGKINFWNTDNFIFDKTIYIY